MVLGSLYTKILIEFMKESGHRIREMEKATNVTRQGTFTSENSKITSLKAKVYIPGRTERSMMDNGLWVKKRVMVYGEEFSATAT